MDLQTRGVLDLDTVFDSSRFDYEQWILQGPDAHGQDDGGSAAIHALVSSYNTFGGQHRSSSLEDEASMETSFSEQWWLGSGYGRVDSAAMEDLTYFCHSFDDVRCKDSCNISVHAEKPALEFSIDTYMYTEEELARLNDGRVTATDLFENFFENCEDDIADNCGIAEGITDLNGQTKVPKKRGGRRQKSHFMKRPMALAEVIFDLLDSEKRENSLRCLSGHLIERRETDLHFYRTAAYQLYFSCSTLAILIQEVLSVYERINTGDLNIRGSKRLANVLTCFQSIAASDETRFPFVRAKIPNLLQPIIFSTFTEEVYENVRAISLSVIDLTCKNCEREVIQWAVESDIVQACLHAIEIGSRLSKLVAMSILESILHDEQALEIICRADSSLVLDIVKMLSHLVAILGVVQDFSRRLIFQVVRCHTLMCQHPRALEVVKDNFPRQLQDRTFHELKQVTTLLINHGWELEKLLSRKR
ncbi:hypothetical protein KC19_4G004000 [Ceratodon purpureus]|uniref:Uncharacterized protein n=1 Tax=Ceratodon purpureus TaxID=3225 RepID=A0A8T0I515_CERPU|nr:hypothetical protein KC19_4G004000 [Ceratodon purpureus]